jgi:hypothetical protein
MAGIFKKFFGFGHKEETTKKTAEEKIPATGGGGFSVKVAVSADITPVLARCYGHGGVQVFFSFTLKTLLKAACFPSCRSSLFRSWFLIQLQQQELEQCAVLCIVYYVDHGG